MRYPLVYLSGTIWHYDVAFLVDALAAYEFQKQGLVTGDKQSRLAATKTRTVPIASEG